MAEAAAVLSTAHIELDDLKPFGSTAEGCHIVESVADRLAALGRLTTSRKLGSALHDWRDHLSSHVLAARDLEGIGVDDGVAAHMLLRGVNDVMADLADWRSGNAPALAS